MSLGVTAMDDVVQVALLCGAMLLVAVQAIPALRPRMKRKSAPIAPRSMQLVFLTAWQDPQPDASVDLKRQEMLLADALRGALDSATMAGTVLVKFCPRELTVWIYTADARRAFMTVAPILGASSYCEAGYVLLQCGPGGAGQRQIKLSDVPISSRDKPDDERQRDHNQPHGHHERDP
jgi:hypothetical protein